LPRRGSTSSASSMTVANTSSFPRLMGDVGGTNARFAVQESPGAQPTQVVTYPSVEFETFDGALKAYVAQLDCPKPLQAAVGCAAASGTSAVGRPGPTDAGSRPSGEGASWRALTGPSVGASALIGPTSRM